MYKSTTFNKYIETKIGDFLIEVVMDLIKSRKIMIEKAMLHIQLQLTL